MPLTHNLTDGAKPGRKLVTSSKRKLLSSSKWKQLGMYVDSVIVAMTLKIINFLISLDKDINELTRMYKANAVARFSKGARVSVEPAAKLNEVKNMKVHWHRGGQTRSCGSLSQHMVAYNAMSALEAIGPCTILAYLNI